VETAYFRRDVPTVHTKTYKISNFYMAQFLFTHFYFAASRHFGSRS